jgi:hypothetical protein
MWWHGANFYTGSIDDYLTILAKIEPKVMVDSLRIPLINNEVTWPQSVFKVNTSYSQVMILSHAVEITANLPLAANY